jgi:hypothetical protein
MTRRAGRGSIGIHMLIYNATCKAAGDSIFAALLAYKSRFGSYPTNLAELRNKLGWKLPKDPYTGGDFTYRRDESGFILYSFGPDLKDHGGMQPIDPSELYKRGDIVWKR